MTLGKRLLGVSALICMFVASPAMADDTLQALSDADAQRYALAFQAADRGDFIDAQVKAAEIQDKSLLDRIFGAAERLGAEWRETATATPRKTTATSAGKAQKAREAYYSGDAKSAMTLAQAGGDRWIAGLSAWRLKSFAKARDLFAEVARDGGEDAWLRAAGAFWASRSAAALGDTAAATEYLRLAAGHSDTFYGMIAERRLAGAANEVRLVKAAYSAPADAASLVKTDARAHRAAALAQLGRGAEADQELHAGAASARSNAEIDLWAALARALGRQAPSARASLGNVSYPTPTLEPKYGFTLDRALVYAVVRQESRFDPTAVSRSGAVGLMQLMPEAAARAAGDDKLKTDMSPLFDPAFNLRVGQDYLTWLMERGVGYDLLRVIAAYNGGPGALMRTAAMLGEEAHDPLLLIETLPAQETRNYVEKVVAGYWGYKRMWGEEVRTLDAVAGGASLIDVRFDLEPNAASAQAAAQTLQIGLR